MYYIGIDIAKHLHTVACVDEVGARHGKAVEFTNDDKGFAFLLERFRELGIEQEDCIICMESTAHYWISLYAYLVDLGFSVAVVNPIMTDAFRKADTVRKTKTDLVDAFLIAEFARFKHPAPTEVSPEVYEELKQLTRFRAQLVCERTAMKNKLTGIMDRLFPELASCIGGATSATGMALMKELKDPETISHTDIRTIERIIREASRGCHGRKKAEEIKQLARDSVGSGWAMRALVLEASHAIELICFLDSEVKALDDEIAHIFKDCSAEVLLTIPGIGPVNAAAIAAEVGDIERFSDPRKLYAFAGIDPTKNQSGRFEGDQEHMSKRGSSYLRYALLNAADVARRYDPYFGDYYDSLKARGKHHYVALSAVARKLCGVIWAILKEQRPYEKRPSVQSRKEELVKS